MNQSTTGGFHGAQDQLGGAEAKKLKQELTDKDAKIKEINDVVQSLKQKLQDKMNEAAKEL